MVCILFSVCFCVQLLAAVLMTGYGQGAGTGAVLEADCRPVYVMVIDLTGGNTYLELVKGAVLAALEAMPTCSLFGLATFTSLVSLNLVVRVSSSVGRQESSLQIWAGCSCSLSYMKVQHRSHVSAAEGGASNGCRLLSPQAATAAICQAHTWQGCWQQHIPLSCCCCWT